MTEQLRARPARPSHCGSVVSSARIRQSFPEKAMPQSLTRVTPVPRKVS